MMEATDDLARALELAADQGLRVYLENGSDRRERWSVSVYADTLDHDLDLRALGRAHGTDVADTVARALEQALADSSSRLLRRRVA